MRRKLVFACGLVLMAATLAFTQDGGPFQGPDGPDGAPADDPPGRAARLSFISGNVSFQPGSVEDWTPATLNRPMTTGDRLWTDNGARAEMNTGSAALRLNGRTSVAILNLDDQTTQVQVSSGSLSVRVRRLADDENFEIDTPQVAMTVLRPGEYRVDVNEDGDATIASVRGGTAEAVAGSQSYTIQAREQLRVTGTDSFVFDQRSIPPADGFDNFCENRDRREDLSQSAQRISRDIPGATDLDGAGVWTEQPDYGWVWTPQGVPVDWAPYHYGHWVWIAPWGWTWVDDAAWGYAPFHYGRWVFIAGRWGWVPGPVVARPVYAPAMVAWVGGGGFSVGIGIGPAVGWFPLAPREVWVPPYRHSRTYIERVNVTNTVIVNRTVITNVNVANVTYVNRNVAGAVTVMPREQMAAGRPVASAAVRPAPAMMANARVQTTSMAAPERTAVIGVHAGARAPAPPARVENRQIVARQAPPPAPVAFERQQQVLRQNPGQPISRGAAAQIQREAPAPRPRIRQATVPPPAGRAPQPGVRPAPENSRPAATEPPRFGRQGQAPEPQVNRPAPASQPPQTERAAPPPAAEPRFGRQGQAPEPQVNRPAPASQPPQTERAAPPPAAEPRFGRQGQAPEPQVNRPAPARQPQGRQAPPPRPEEARPAPAPQPQVERRQAPEARPPARVPENEANPAPPPRTRENSRGEPKRPPEKKEEHKDERK